jgi:hypothetical protein
LGEGTSLRPPQPLPYYSDEDAEDESVDSSEGGDDDDDDEAGETVQEDDYEEDLDEESLLKTIDGYTVDGFVVDDPCSDEEEEDGESSDVCRISPLSMFLTYEVSRRKVLNSLIPKTMTTTDLKKKTMFIPNSASKMKDWGK